MIITNHASQDLVLFLLTLNVAYTASINNANPGAVEKQTMSEAHGITTLDGALYCSAPDPVENYCYACCHCDDDDQMWCNALGDCQTNNPNQCDPPVCGCVGGGQNSALGESAASVARLVDL